MSNSVVCLNFTYGGTVFKTDNGGSPYKPNDYFYLVPESGNRVYEYGCSEIVIQNSEGTTESASSDLNTLDLEVVEIASAYFASFLIAGYALGVAVKFLSKV